MQQNADKAMGREPRNCSPKPTQKLQRHADKIMGRESSESGANNQSCEPPATRCLYNGAKTNKNEQKKQWKSRESNPDKQAQIAHHHR
jgi:hypothetical protein